MGIPTGEQSVLLIVYAYRAKNHELQSGHLHGGR